MEVKINVEKELYKLFVTFLEKTCQNIWRFKQNVLPLHSL